LRHHVLRDLVEGFAVAEESGDRNQQIAEQRLRFVDAVAQHVVIFLQAVRMSDLHAARDPPQHRRALVFGEIVAGAHAQVRQDAAQQVLVEIPEFRDRDVLFDANEIGETPGEVAHRHDEIGDAGGDGAARHRGVFGFVGSWTRMMPPDSLTARTPVAPSEPAPLRITAKPSPSCSATDRKNRSIAARWPRGSSNASAETSWSIICRRRSGGIT
jgi:hypothetical protein